MPALASFTKNLRFKLVFTQYCPQNRFTSFHIVSRFDLLCVLLSRSVKWIHWSLLTGL